MKVPSRKFSETLFNELERFKCPVCHDIVQNVRELPCKHLFCFDCLEAYKEQNERKESLICPLCRKRITKRKILSRDAALDSLSIFVRALSDDIKLHHGTEAMNHFDRVFSRENMCKSRYDSDEIIPNSSDENQIPSLSKHISIKNPSIHPVLKSRKAPKALTTENEGPSLDGKKKKLKPKIGLSRKQNQKDLSASDNNLCKLKTKNLDLNNQNTFKNKKKIIEWLNDTRNMFERYSQTQSYSYNSQDNTIRDIDMPSVSQIYEKNRSEKNNLINISDIQVCSDKQKGIKYRKTRSVVSSPSKKVANLRRHSLECTYPINIKKQKYVEEENIIENHVLINIIEDEVLDVIDKEITSEGNNETNASSENQQKENQLNVMNMEEDRFLDQLENEKFENAVQTQKIVNIHTNKEQKTKSSWKNIKKLKKTVGQVKAPKKLNISLQSTQKSSKKDPETKFSNSEICEPSIINQMKNKSVDYQAMEDYFKKTLPEIIQNNAVGMCSENLGNSLSSKDSSTNRELVKDDDSDIYVYQTQPLSEEIIDPKIERIHYASELSKKLESVLNQLIEKDKIQMEELTPLWPSIQKLFQIFSKFPHVNDFNLHRLSEDKSQMKFSEKQVQTDMVSLEGFNITPTAAFKTFIEDVVTQSDNQDSDCLQIGIEEAKMVTNNEYSGPQEGSHFKNEHIEPKDVSMHTVSKQIPEVSILEEEIVQIPNGNTEPIDKVAKCYSSRELSLGNVSRASINISGNAPTTPLLSEKHNGSDGITNSEKAENISPGSAILRCIPPSSSNQQHISRELSLGNVSRSSRNISGNAPTTPLLSEKQNRSDEITNSERAKNISPGSGILCSIPPSSSKVNRRLMFERAIEERKGLGQTLKRMRSTIGPSDCDEERPHKVKCDRFLQEDLSIHFETQSIQDTQFLENADMIMEEEAHKDSSMNLQPNSHSNKQTEDILANSKKENVKNHTQVDNLLNYCDELIEKANKQIFGSNILPADVKGPRTSSDSQKFNSDNGLKDKCKSQKQVKTQANEKIGTQDLLKHYEELIEKAGRQIGKENTEHHKTSTQISTTSKDEVFLEDAQKLACTLKTQDLIDHFDSLMEKNTKKISDIENNKCNTVDGKTNGESENDDEFFCENLDQLDNVLEKENKRLDKSENKQSESLFESCKDSDSAIRNKSKIEEDKIYDTPKGRKNIEKKKEKRKNDQTKSKSTDPFDSSDEEIFSDGDVVDTTPQKSISFIERLSCSQLIDPNARVSLKSQTLQNLSENMIVPPPPGFDDEIACEEKPNLNENLPSSERESENVIPNSLSPMQFQVPSKKKPQSNVNVNSKKEISQPGLPTLSQFTEVSPICKEKSTNLNIIEMARQSSFSPLIMKPKPSTPVLTSTPKQKSILSYMKPQITSSQEGSTSRFAKSKPCIAFSRLSNAETLCVLALCNKNLVTREDKFEPHVTHMIVSVDKQNYVKDHTIKFISAIAAGIWVVNIKWVQECLSQNAIVNEEPFEVFDITGIPSPKISRLSRMTNPLLKGFKFYIPRSFTQTSVEDVKNIIQLLQGVVVSSIDELKDRDGHICIIICELIDTEDYTQYEEWVSSYKVLTVDINWLSLSVSRYKLLSLRPHLLCSDDTINELGYPLNLIEDVPPTLTQEVTTYN